MKHKIIPGNLVGKDMFDFIVKNEALIIHAMKSEIKKADAVVFSTMHVNEKGELATKDEVSGIASASDKLKVQVVINTTNWFDSHWDVHIPGIWKKSLSENNKNGFYLLKQHERGFESVIGEGMMATTQGMSWRELGLKIEGSTEALVFNGIIDKERNPFMFEQYKKGYVKQHSVGMRYVKMVTCINDDDYPVQKENWDKYFPMVANQKECQEGGLFWAILEAKVVEGSAVLFGSNSMTPTTEVSAYDNSKNQNTTGTVDQPLQSTEEQPQNEGVSWDKMAETLESILIK